MFINNKLKIIALERAEITQLSNTAWKMESKGIALERAEITQLSNSNRYSNRILIALERAEITQLSNLKPQMFDFRVSSVLDC